MLSLRQFILCRIVLLVLTILLCTSIESLAGGEADVLLDVPYVSQGLTNWCGLASQCMLLRYYDIQKHLWEVAKEYGFAPEDGISGAPTLLDSKSYDEIESYFLEENGLAVEWYQWSHLPAFRPSSDDVRSWIETRIDRSNPVIMFLTGSIGHSVVITGYEYDNGRCYVFLHDPSGALIETIPGIVYIPGSIQMHVRVPWEILFEAANSWIADRWYGIPIPAVAPQRLLAVINATSAPKVATMQLGKGSQLGGIVTSGLVGIFIEDGDSQIRAELQMHEGLHWRTVKKDGRYLSVDTPPPTHWNSAGSRITLEGGASGIDFVNITDGSSAKVEVKLRFMLLKADQIDKVPLREIERDLTIQPSSSAPVGYLELPFDNLQSGAYVPAILIEVPDIPQGTYYILMPPIAIEEEPEYVEHGMLDVVFCIDKSGSMADDIEAVQKVLDEVLQELNTYVSENNISLQLGLVTYTRHDDVESFGTQWLQAQPLTSDIEKIKKSIAEIRILGAQAGAGGWEDMYAALLCGMGAQDLLENVAIRDKYGQPDGSRNFLDMGWRSGACKICLPIGDEPPSNPDWKGRRLATVVERAINLDPVHMYPIVVQGPIESWLLGTKRAMNNLAEHTGGQVTHVSKAEELPSALVNTVKLAVRRHRNEVWRKGHPPYALYGMALVIGLAVIFAFLGVFIAQFHGQQKNLTQP
jgi:hypothetical protein